MKNFSNDSVQNIIADGRELNESAPASGRRHNLTWQAKNLRLRFGQVSQTITVHPGKELSSWLEETAARTGLSQGQIVREQLEKAKSAKEEKPFMRLAGSIRGLPRDLSRRKGYSTKARA